MYKYPVLTKKLVQFLSNMSNNIKNKKGLRLYFEFLYLSFRSPQEVRKITKNPLRTNERNFRKFRKGEGLKRKVGTNRFLKNVSKRKASNASVGG
jgi:hypothetical protein